MEEQLQLRPHMLNFKKNNKQIIFKGFFALVICLSNFWIYQIYKFNFFFGEVLVVETVLLFLSLYIKNRAISILIFIIFVVLSFSLYRNRFDKNVFSSSTVESIQTEERRQFYSNEIGKIYRNRVGILYFDTLRLYSNKISNNFFSALDLSLYFSPNSLMENEKYPLILAPFFIIGFLALLVAKNQTISIVYFILALFQNSLINLDSKIGPLLMFPFITLCITLGLIQFVKIVWLKYKKFV